MADRSAIFAGEGQDQEYAFLGLSGPMQKPGRTLQDVTRIGYNGAAFRQLGRKGNPYYLEGVVDCATPEDADQFVFELARDWQGSLVTVLDDHSMGHPDQMLLAVENLGIKAIGASAGGVSGVDNPGVLLSVRLVLMDCSY